MGNIYKALQYMYIYKQYSMVFMDINFTSIVVSLGLDDSTNIFEPFSFHTFRANHVN